VTTGGRERGQALVEFSLAIMVFLVIIMGIIDVSRLVYQYNGVAEAARSLAREASVHPGTTLGNSAEMASVLATQRLLVQGLGTPTYTCIDLSGATVSGTCQPGNWAKVTISSSFYPVTPLATILGSISLSAAASAKIE
jgi:Flp pilus assembly protein TadG